MSVENTDDTHNLLDVVTKTLPEKQRKKVKRTKKKNSNALLPVKQATEVWDKEDLQIEVAKAMIGPITSKIVKELPVKFVESSTVSVEDAKQWIPRGIQGIKGKPVNYRKSGRENKLFEMEPGYFPIASSGIDLNLNAQADTEIATAKEKIDVAAQIFDNILQYGRRTMDELVEDMGAYQAEMIVLITNGMIHDHFLKRVQEMELDSITGEPILDAKKKKPKIVETIELVDKDEREKRLQKRRLEEIKKRKLQDKKI
jgi:hypothetical protein